jgi:hypothetical protein
MISGRQALATVEQAIALARSSETRLDLALRDAEEQAAAFRRQRMESFRKLARLRLGELTSGEVIGEINRIEREALDRLKSGREQIREATARRTAAQDRVREIEAERNRRAEDLEVALNALEERRTSVEAEFLLSPEWAENRRRLEEARNVADMAEAKARLAEQDRERKRQPYEHDPLFMYLWKIRFATPDYSALSLVRYVDGKIAKLIDFSRARVNYAMLHDIPDRLKAHASRKRREHEIAESELRKLERAALVKAGVEPLEAQVASLQAEMEKIEHQLAEAQASLQELDRAHQGLGDPYHAAVELLAKADAALDLRDLYDRTARTPDPSDETIVRDIEAAEAAIGGAERQIGIIRREIRELAERRVEIERARDDFKRQGYASPSATFGNERVIASVLGGVLEGLVSATVLRETLKDGYRRQSGPWESRFGSEQAGEEETTGVRASSMEN